MIKIGELSSITDVSIQTIRFYEKEGLLSPIEVDHWTNYRYYDETSVERLSEISYLKSLGFSLKEIKNLSEKAIKDKIAQTEVNIRKLVNNIHKLSTICKKDGGFVMKTFVNDEKMIGKWKKLGVVQRKEDYKNKNFDDNEIFNFPEIYFLPNGEKYWVFSWTKGILYLKDRPFPYEIIDGKMFVGIVDEKTNTIDNYAIYEKENDKHYSKEEIAIKDDTNIPFIMDKEVVGSWVSVDFVANIKDFELNKEQYKQNLFLKKLVFEKDGKLYVELDGCSVLYSHTWSKGFFINKMSSTVSEYYIKNISGIDIMFIEWKSGDYTFGGKIRGYYVLQRL